MKHSIISINFTEKNKVKIEVHKVPLNGKGHGGRSPKSHVNLMHERIGPSGQNSLRAEF